MLIIQRPNVEMLDEEEGNRQRFAIGPLDPGFGHTLGNSLRRTLLSSIPGAAVTQIRLDEALHEFTVIPGVKEDVSDLILNLKDLVLTSESDEPVTLRIDVRGPAKVTGADRLDFDEGAGGPIVVFDAKPKQKATRTLTIVEGLSRSLRLDGLTEKVVRALLL